MQFIGEMQNTNNIQQNPTFGVQKKKKTTKKLSRAQIEKNKNDAKELEQEYLIKKEGFVATACDKIKTMTALGKNSDIAKLKVEQLKKGQISKKNAESYLKQYQYNHKDETEMVTDLLAGGAALAVYTSLKKSQIIEQSTKGKNETFTTAVLVGVSILTGAVVKPILKALNSIGMDKDTRKKNQRIGKDIITGGIDGALAPLTVAKSLLLGIPAALGVNTVSRYLTIDKDDKTLSDFASQQIENFGLKAIAAGAVIAGSVASSQSIKNFKEEYKTAIKHADKLKYSDERGRASFVEVESVLGLMDDPEVKKVLEDKTLTPTQKMAELEKINIFYPKYLQTMNVDMYDEEMKPENINKYLNAHLTKDADVSVRNKMRTDRLASLQAQKEVVHDCKAECPVSRTFEDAIKEVETVYGKKYLLMKGKALGCGSIAESYLATESETGNKVVIKMLKKGVTAERFEKDRESALKRLQSSNLSEKDKTRYKSVINGLYDGWIKEVNLRNEFDATGKLAVSVKAAKGVRPIDVKDNIFVMDLAEGGAMQDINKYMSDRNIVLTEEEKQGLINQYQKIVAEQLVNIPSSGYKIIHGDPHDANILVNPANKQSSFTFIDAGNVIERKNMRDCVDDALNYIDVLTGNVEGISQYVLKGAKTFNDTAIDEKKLTDIQKYMTRELKKKLFNGSKKPESVVEVMSVANRIAKNKNIKLDEQQSHYIKAQATHSSNMAHLAEGFGYTQEEVQCAQNRAILDEAISSLRRVYSSVDSDTQSAIKSRLNYVYSQEGRKQAMTYLGSNCNSYLHGQALQLKKKK